MLRIIAPCLREEEWQDFLVEAVAAASEELLADDERRARADRRLSGT
jgi:hypothetical protein